MSMSSSFQKLFNQFKPQAPERARANQLGTDVLNTQKKHEKGYFFTDGQCAALSSFRAGKIQVF